MQVHCVNFCIHASYFFDSLVFHWFSLNIPHYIIKLTKKLHFINTDDLESLEPPEEAPTKCITETVELEVKCSVRYIDFEGRSDGESMLKIMQQIKPREVILVRGEPKATQLFAESIRK